MKIHTFQPLVSQRSVHVVHSLYDTQPSLVGLENSSRRIKSFTSQSYSNDDSDPGIPVKLQDHGEAEGSRGQESGAKESQPRPLVIKPRPASRQAGEPPKPIEIERTSSFLIRKKDRYEKRGEDSVSATSTQDMDDEEGPVSWMLRKTDQSLDAVEENVPDAAKSAITFVTGNLGNNTSKVAVDAAKLAAKGSAKLLEAALPAGKWAISKGFGAVVSVAMKQQGKKNDRPKQKDDNTANL